MTAVEVGRPDEPGSATASLAEIEKALITAYPGLPERVLTEEEARTRAQMVFSDMAAIRFPLELELWPVHIRGFPPCGVPAYKLRDSMFNVDAAPERSDVIKAEGPGLSCGDLLKLSKACKLGREHLSSQWPAVFASRLRNPNDHPAVIEEMLWLGFWHSVDSVVHSYRQNPGNNKNLDWRFRCSRHIGPGQIINLEVKYRRRDWVGIVDREYFSRDFDSYFDDARGKFGPRPEGELNVVGISTLAPPDRGLRLCIDRFLGSEPHIDAVILWSYHAPKGEPWEVHSNHAELVRRVFSGGDSEDQSRMSPIKHVWRKSDERRALRPGELPETLLRQLEEGL